MRFAARPEIRCCPKRDDRQSGWQRLVSSESRFVRSRFVRVSFRPSFVSSGTRFVRLVSSESRFVRVSFRPTGFVRAGFVRLVSSDSFCIPGSLLLLLILPLLQLLLIPTLDGRLGIYEWRVIYEWNPENLWRVLYDGWSAKKHDHGCEAGYCRTHVNPTHFPGTGRCPGHAQFQWNTDLLFW